MDATTSIKVVDGQEFDLENKSDRIEYAQVIWSKYINKMANRYSSAVCSYQDFVQESKIIIMLADNKWNPERANDTSCTYKSYIFKCIRNGLIELWCRNREGVGIPSGSRYSKKADFKSSRIIDNLSENFQPFETIDVIDFIESFDSQEIGKMFFVQGLTIQEISDITETSSSAVGRTIDNMRDNMRIRL